MSSAPKFVVTPKQLLAVGGAVVLLAAAGFIGHAVLAPSPQIVQLKPSAKVCAVTTVSTASIQAAVKSCANGGIVTIPKGTFALNGNVIVNSPETVEGAGATSTFLVQHARTNIFQITAPGVTIEDLDVNTATFNPGVPPILKNPVPGTIFSAQSNTHILNLDSESGTGFGFRLTGPNPCQSQQISGDVIQNVSSTNTGTGGFTAMDFDCMSSGTITNVTIHGDYIALYESSHVTINGLVYYQGPYESGKCGADVYVTGPAVNDLIENVVTHNGGVHSGGTSNGAITGLRVVNETRIGGCTNGL